MTLSDRGQLFVSLAAGESFAQHTGLRIEEARRRLTELLLGARLQQDGTWRRRNRTDRVDISASVVKEGALVIVTRVYCRPTGR